MADDPFQLPEEFKSGRLSEKKEKPFGDKAKTLVRLVAAGFFLVGALDVLAYWFKCRQDHTELSIWRCLVSGIPVVIGVILLIKTSALAQRIEDWLEQ